LEKLGTSEKVLEPTEKYLMDSPEVHYEIRLGLVIWPLGLFDFLLFNTFGDHFDQVACGLSKEVLRHFKSSLKDNFIYEINHFILHHHHFKVY
jgi:hypothetical protein